MVDRKVRLMYAMSLDWHLTKALKENSFAAVSDKLRDQMIEGGMAPREAAMKAPVMLDGMDRAFQRQFDFKRIRNELAAERRGHGASDFMLDTVDW
ncbi:hypothetical protein [Bordetella genomosp. 11]|nr:hypothetical protein [Bordetella genomosp. 11]